LRVDNFNIRIDDSSEMGWEVLGLDSFSPCKSVGLIYYRESRDDLGRNVDVNIIEAHEEKTGKHEHDELEESRANINELCYSFGVLLHQIFLASHQSKFINKIRKLI
jgi:hypothetical protein